MGRECKYPIPEASGSKTNALNDLHAFCSPKASGYPKPYPELLSWFQSSVRRLSGDGNMYL